MRRIARGRRRFLIACCLSFWGIIAHGSQAQSGLRAEYYVGSSTYGAHPDRAKLFAPNNLRKVGLTSGVNFYDGIINPPVNGLPANYYGIRWLGQFLNDATGDYSFTATAQDGFRFWLSDQPIDPKKDAPLLNHWSDGKGEFGVSTQNVHLEAGAKYYLLFEMYATTNVSYASLRFKSGSDLPTERLYPEISDDRTPPGKITDLSVVSTMERTAMLHWTATGDDTGNATFYDLRYSYAPIDSSNFDAATPAIYAPAPATPGTSQSYTVVSLLPLRTYYFAMRAGDAAGNLGDVSNNATGATQPFNVPLEHENGLLREAYYNFNFDTYASIDRMREDIRYPGDPNSVSYVSAFKTPNDVAIDYGERVRGYVTPPLTGDYVFWIAADDCGQLLLSSDENPLHSKGIAKAPDYTGENEWTRYPEQQSAPIRLEVGKRYYIEALHGQISGGSKLTVQWRLPNNKIESPIPMSRLTPYPYPRSFGRISGYLTDANGQPVSGARVVVTQGDFVFGGRADANGFYTTLAPSGLAQVSAYQPDSPYDARASIVTVVSPNVASAVNFKLPDYFGKELPRTLSLTGTLSDGSSSASLYFSYPWLAADEDNDLYFTGGSNAIGKMNAEGDLLPVLSDDPFLLKENLYGLEGLALNRNGDLFIARSYGNQILKLDKASGTISVVAGTGKSGFSGDGGLAIKASLNTPSHITVDDSGNLYLVDFGNHRIRKIDENGIITTVAGVGTNGFSGDGGAALLAKLNDPGGIAVDLAGDLYIADFSNGRVRKVDTRGIITTVAGTISETIEDNSGFGSLTTLEAPSDLAVDALGNLYILSFRYFYTLQPDGFLKYEPIDITGDSVALNSRGDFFFSMRDSKVMQYKRAAGPGLLSPVSLSAPNSTALPAGVTVQLAATDSRDLSASPSSFQWSVDGLPGGSAEVGRIDANGVFTAPLNAGTYVLTAEHDGAIGALKVSVVEPDAPLLSLGSATLDPGASATLSISATAALSDVSGLDLLLRAVGSDGAPPLTPVLESGANAKDWQVISDPGDPWHFTIYSPSGAGLSGPAELMKLTVSADATAPHGATYAITARSLLATTSDGRWRTNRARVSSGAVTISKAAKGDMNGDGKIDMKDVTLSLRLALGLDPSSASAIAAGDANCDGKLTIVDATLLLQKAVGLSPSAWCEG